MTDVTGVLDAVLCSPPYADQVIRGSGRNLDELADVPKAAGTWYGRLANGNHPFDAYGHAPGQLGNLAGPFPRGDVPMPDCEWQDWPMSECYGQQWGDLIVPETAAHPAKFSRLLVFKIVAFGLERGFWKPGDLVADPFGGVALGGIACAYSGLRWVGVELESEANGGSPFVELGNRNIDLHRRELGVWGYPVPVLVQGDSRNFAAIVGGQVAAVVTSPPFAGVLQDHDKRENIEALTRKDGKPFGMGKSVTKSYGTDPANVGNLPAGTLDGVLTSPPYADMASRERSKEPWAVQHGKAEYGDGDPSRHVDGYGTTPGNVGNLKDAGLDAVVTSPPFSEPGSQPVGNCPGRPVRSRLREQGLDKATGEEYGTTPGQVGKESGETYWQACAAIYAQVRQALKPGGVFALVVKDYVSKKQRVPLCDQTAQLLTHLGFEVFLRVRAWLVKESRHPSLFGGEIAERKKRCSFFRRLYEVKYPQNAIDFEEVLWARKSISPTAESAASQSSITVATGCGPQADATTVAPPVASEGRSKRRPRKPRAGASSAGS